MTDGPHHLMYTTPISMTANGAAFRAARCNAVKKMLDFEEDVGGGKPKKALILGLGNRVRAYKKLIGEAMNTKEPQLMELSELREHQSNQAPGTPKGNKSIATFCVSKKWKSSDL
jgi:hypothetical protein